MTDQTPQVGAPPPALDTSAAHGQALAALATGFPISPALAAALGEDGVAAVEAEHAEAERQAAAEAEKPARRSGKGDKAATTTETTPAVSAGEA